MPIKLPAINDACFLGMTVCGRLQPDRPTLDQIFDRPKSWQIVANTGPDQDGLILGVYWGTKESRRIHIDYVMESEYNDVLDDEKVKIEEIQGHLDRVAGELISGTFFGRYRLPLSALPERGFINESRFSIEHGQVSIAMSGGELAIVGAPVRSLKWKIENDVDVVVEIGGKIDTTIDPEYLTRLYSLLNQCFSILVLARDGHANL